jgi:signal transduction histidine kinase
MVSILDEKNKNLTELAALKDKFFGLASHDLRGPLTAISGYSELIKEDLKNLPPETLEEFIDSISKAATDMLRLLNDLLDISAIESGNLELNFHPESLKKLIEEEVRIQQEFANKKNITLKCDVENIPEFSLDRVRVGQVLYNLISNAIKFSPPGKQISIHLTQDNGDAKVSVEDQGPGISPEDQNKLFEAFQKLKAKPTGGESSFGLGLAITKKVIEAHQGKLDFESKPGQGTTFFFTLPMQTK